MKTQVILPLLVLLAGRAAAQQPTPPAAPQPAADEKPAPNRAYAIRDGKFQLVDVQPAKTAPLGEGSYRARPYALRVQVPAPHPDSGAVVTLGREVAPTMPKQTLPPVRLVPEGSKRKAR